jgi:hypothetical protein
MAADEERYPVKPLDDDDDSRFTFGFILEVADLLNRHGYPEIKCGTDYVRLRQALWGFLYSPKPLHYF